MGKTLKINHVHFVEKVKKKNQLKSQEKIKNQKNLVRFFFSNALPLVFVLLLNIEDSPTYPNEKVREEEDVKNQLQVPDLCMYTFRIMPITILDGTLKTKKTKYILLQLLDFPSRPNR